MFSFLPGCQRLSGSFSAGTMVDAELVWECCRTGDLERLRAIPDLASDDAHGTLAWGFFEACTHGHLHVAQWLHATFDLTPSFIYQGSLLWPFMRGRHLHVAQWLVDTFYAQVDWDAAEWADLAYTLRYLGVDLPDMPPK